MSELLRPQQRVGQVHEQAHRHEQADRRSRVSSAPYSSRSQAATYAAATMKNTIVMTTNSTSSISLAPAPGYHGAALLPNHQIKPTVNVC